MSKRRASVLGKRGAGTHQPECVQNNRPAGEVKPVISKSKHGKMIRTFHDLDENPLPDFAGARRALGGLIWACLVIAIFSIAMCGATVAHGQSSPDMEFRSLFQIRYALPDTVEIQHIGYNLRINAAGVECVPLNPAMGSMPSIPVQNWLIGDAGEWIGVTRSGATVTLWNCCGADMYLEIATDRQVADFYNMAPVTLTWKERNKM